MTIGTSTLAPADLPLMPEADARALLAEMRAPHEVPTDWWGPADVAIAFTADPYAAVLAADAIARGDLGGSILSVVDGPLALVMVGTPGTAYVDWRPATADDPYGLVACVVRRARAEVPAAELAAIAAAELAARIAAEDEAEDLGGLHHDERLTCHTCRVWATPAHIASDAHRRATGGRPPEVRDARW